LKKLLILTVPVLLSSCIYNATKKQENICSLHNERMHKALVRTIYGKPMHFYGYPGYPNARHPQLMGCIVRLPRKTSAIRYVCSECDRLKRLDRK
jgi:hypothetical protein